VEVFGDGCVAVLEDFRRLELVRHGKRQSSRSWLRQDKGHHAEWVAFSECIRNSGSSPIPFEDIATSTLATIRILDSLRSGNSTKVSMEVPDLTLAPLVS
jgi:hypothetical protein